MVGFLSQILGELLAIDELALGVSFDKWVICIQWFFGVSFAKSGQERDGNLIIEFFIDEVDDFLRD